jgi:ferredoxin
MGNIVRATTGAVMKITVDTTACIGAGQCALVAGELFDQDDDGIVVLLDDQPAESQQAMATRAAGLCPARAIAVTA